MAGHRLWMLPCNPELVSPTCFLKKGRFLTCKHKLEFTNSRCAIDVFGSHHRVMDFSAKAEDAIRRLRFYAEDCEANPRSERDVPS
jgi:hypothetical protein